MRTRFHRRQVLAGLAAAPALLGRPALASDGFPARPVRLIVPFPPGGSTDVIGRIIANEMSKRLGQNVIVENRPGVSGTLGSTIAAKSAADGYTVLFSNVASQGVAPALMPDKVLFDPIDGFTHIGMIGVYWATLLVNPSFPAKTLKEFIAEAKRRPGEINFATSGTGSSPHLFVEMLKVAAGIDIVHIPYRGAGPALTALLGNEIPAMGDSLPSATAHIRRGSVRPLAVSSAKRVPAFPDIPTFVEEGYPSLALDNWYGISGPPGIPEPVVARLRDALNASIQDPAVIERLSQVGLEARVMNGAEFRSFIAKMFDTWKETIKIAGVKAD